jgi:hypothetical protein
MYSARAFFFITFLLAACGGDDGDKAASDAAVDTQSIDAMVDASTGSMFDLTCLGNTEMSADADVTLTGTVQQASFSGLSDVEGAAVRACVVGSDCTAENEKDTDTSAQDGSFTLGPIATGDVPLDVYIELTGSGLRETHTYPAQRFVTDQGGIPVLTFDPTLLSIIPDCDQNDETNGMLGIAVADCANTPISDTANINLTVKQGGTTVTGTSLIDLGSFGDAFAGAYLICNVPANAGSTTTEVGATYKSMTFRAHDVKVVAGTTTATIVRPGF